MLVERSKYVDGDVDYHFIYLVSGEIRQNYLNYSGMEHLNGESGPIAAYVVQTQ
jgi:hypothetical protein